MELSKEDLLFAAEASQFRAEILEKVFHMTEVLSEVMSHNYFRQRLVLKGGTALNLFYFNMPRLSVDIDLNYIGLLDRDMMLSDRTKLENDLAGLCQRLGLTVRRSPSGHAGGKWRLSFKSALLQGGNIEIDISYMYRLPLWPIEICDSKKIGPYQLKKIPVLNIHEVAAGKIAALFARSTSRDLFDTHHLLTQRQFDLQKLRLSCLLYGAMSKRDWRKLDIEKIDFNKHELQKKLLPMLQNSVRNKTAHIVELQHGIEKTRTALKNLLFPLAEHETEFLTRLLDHGDIKPELLTDDQRMIEQINHHPGLVWKAQNAKKYAVN